MPSPAMRLGRAVCAAALLAFAASGSALAQAQTTRLRGIIETADAAHVVIKTREGTSVPVKLKAPVSVGLRLAATTAAITPNVFVGVTSVPGPGETLKAIEVFIFPEAMRGTGEGHRPWDGQPDATMTNATLAETVTSANGSVMKLTYKGGEKSVLLTPETKVQTFAQGTVDDLKPGAPVFATVEATPDGGAQTSRLTVEKP